MDFKSLGFPSIKILESLNSFNIINAHPFEYFRSSEFCTF